jgi:hypothetical protein
MAGNYLRGAFIQLNDSFPLPVPQLILFQYNPETMTHTWTPSQSGGQSSPGQSPSNPLAITGPPEESFSFTLFMDSNDTIADNNPVTAPVAQASGLAPRLAALELLLFPTPPPGGGLVGAISSAITGTSVPPAFVPAFQLPVVFFIWGPGRVAPVRLTGLTITERLYDSTTLFPIHAEASIQLKVLTAPELNFLDGPLGTAARAVSTSMNSVRQTLAAANLANSTESIAGMLPV